MIILKKYSLLIVVMAVFTFVSSGAHASFRDDGAACFKKDSTWLTFFDGYLGSSKIEYIAPIRSKSHMEKGARVRAKMYINGQSFGTQTLKANNPSKSYCVGGCGPGCSGGVSQRQIGALDCMEHDVCGIIFKGTNPFSPKDKHCGNEWRNAEDNYRTYFKPFAVKRCRNKWK